MLLQALRAHYGQRAKLHGACKRNDLLYVFTGTVAAHFCIATYRPTVYGVRMHSAHTYSDYADALQVWQRVQAS